MEFYAVLRARPLAPRSGVWYNTHRARQTVHIQPQGSANAEQGLRPQGLGPYLFHCDKMRTIAYIDGGNLYHGLLRGCPASKWLDR